MPTKPDSRASLILTIIAQECERLGHGLSLAEAREALAAAGHVVPKSFTAEVGSLRRRGLLVSSGRRGALRYAPKGFATREKGPRTDAEIVYEALVRATRRAGTMVSTHAVTREIRRRGWELATADQNAVRTRLKNLARAPEGRMHETRQGPLVRHASIQGADRRPRSFWAPINQPGLRPPSTTAVSHAEAVRSACGAAVLAVGRPVSGPELRLFVAALPDGDPLKEVLAPRGANPQITTFLRNAERKAGAHGIRALTTPLTVRGGAPIRFWMGTVDDSPSGESVGACWMDDFIYAYRPGLEWAEVARLRQTFASDDIQALSPLLDAREAALRTLGASLLGAFPADAGVSLALAEAANQTLWRWEHSRPNRSEKDRRRVVALRARAAAQQKARSFFAGLEPAYPGPADLHRVVGAAGAVPLAVVEPFARAYIDLASNPRAIHSALEPCRRFPNPEHNGAHRLPTGEAHADDRTISTVALARVDRAEALVMLATLQPDPWTSMMLRRGYSLLGEVSRDSQLLAQVLGASMRAGRTSRYVRRWILIAAALVGSQSAVDYASEIAQAKDGYNTEFHADLRAALLAVALAAPDQVARWARELAGKQDDYAAVELLERASTRAARGHYFSVAAR